MPSRAWFARIPNRKGLLVAGTEFGLYISFDDGENWKPFQLNMPVTPITDLAFHKREKELVVATQGRAFYVLDDVPLLYQLNGGAATEDAHLFQPKDTYRFGAGGAWRRRRRRGGGGRRESAGRRGDLLLVEGQAEGRGHAGVSGCRGQSRSTQFSSKAVERPRAAGGEEEEENPFRGAGRRAFRRRRE